MKWINYIHQKDLSKRFLPNLANLFDRKDKSILSINDHQHPIIALLKGPDTQYRNVLTQDNDVPIINSQCRDKNSFLQIHVRKLKCRHLVLIIKFNFC
jgi:hypothetical protein